jgi:hypothetical protein
VLLLLVIEQGNVLLPGHFILPFDLAIVLEKLRARRDMRIIQSLRFGVEKSGPNIKEQPYLRRYGCSVCSGDIQKLLTKSFNASMLEA